MAPAVDRRRELARWTVAGALLGFLLGLAQAPRPWAGQALAVAGEAAFTAIVLGLAAHGACRLWLTRRGA